MKHFLTNAAVVLRLLITVNVDLVAVLLLTLHGPQQLASEIEHARRRTHHTIQTLLFDLLSQLLQLQILKSPPRNIVEPLLEALAGSDNALAFCTDGMSSVPGQRSCVAAELALKKFVDGFTVPSYSVYCVKITSRVLVTAFAKRSTNEVFLLELVQDKRGFGNKGLRAMKDLEQLAPLRR